MTSLSQLKYKTKQSIINNNSIVKTKITSVVHNPSQSLYMLKIVCNIH